MANQLNHAVPLTLQRKTPLEIQALEVLYSDDKNPPQSTVKDYASALGLNYELVRRWYIERRRRDRENVGQIQGGNGSARCVTKSKNKTKNDKRLSVVEVTDERNSYTRPGIVQDKLYPPDYIFKKIFRKDGPPLGSEFDSLPTSAFQGRNVVTDIRCSNATDQDEQRAPKRRKVSKASEKQSQTKAPIKHGKGKGLMSVWPLTSNASIPENARASKENKGLSCKNKPQAKRHGMGKGLMIIREQTDIGSVNLRKKKSSTRKPVARRKPVSKVQEKSKPSVRPRRVDSSCNKKQKAHREICKLALDTGSYEVSLSSSPELLDDEELELRNLQAEPSALTCSSHFNTGGSHGCSLCKGLLPKFPPDFVKMKKPLPVHPWGSTPKLEKNLFKVFHFLYTYAATLNLCPFTFDEFAKAFIWKESLLLGKVHICLLLHLLSDVDVQLSSDISIHSNKNGMFLNLLHTVGSQKSMVGVWKTSLNPLTWAEIFRQVMVAAGFGGRDGTQRKRCIHKGAEHMVKFGLRPGTLKAALFDILFERGNKGVKVTELAKSSQVVDLNLGKLDDELEDSICSILAGDITLFEKISLSTYRLRLSSILQKDEDGQSDAEGCGSIYDEYRDDNVVDVNYSEFDSGNSTSRLNSALHIGEDNALTVYTEIDESHPGESWLLGLLEGEYSDLSIEEKLDGLLALIDLLSASSSIRMKDPSTMLTESVPNIYLQASGGKIKRSTLRQPSSPTSSWVDVRETHGARNGYQSLEVCPVDSSVAFSMSCDKEKSLDKEIGSMGTGVGAHLHPMQSIFLGSDRRYNRYWLFLGPCDADDPGHTRIYFESSEDGQWQVIESEQALCGIVGTLNNQGRREAVLLESLEKRMPFLLREMSSKVIVETEISDSTHSDISGIDMVNEDSPSPVSGIDNNLSLAESSPHAVISIDTTVVVDKVKVQRQTYTSLQAYDMWIWNCFYSVLHAVKCGKQSYSESLTRCVSCHDLYWRDERHCKTCHTTFELDIDLEEKYDIHVAMCRGPEDTDICPMHKVLPSQLQALKAAAHAIELVMPEDALVGAWQKSAHKLWVRRLRRTSSLHELLQVLADFVAAINVDWLSQCNAELNCDSFDDDIVSCFQTMPQTLSAIALWLVKLDSLIAPHLDEVVEV
ncbi:homeobox-DDT domain protein RLT3 isoform X2 [Silene latifolia]|uniref:homeobox-DDT domain protein RLT3 isoform X2 n=1 Tax=Silene latifolia TaxID=37657 RepID=UPI003D775E12